jgi:hypothetical protein
LVDVASDGFTLRASVVARRQRYRLAERSDGRKRGAIRKAGRLRKSGVARGTPRLIQKRRAAVSSADCVSQQFGSFIAPPAADDAWLGKNGIVRTQDVRAPACRTPAN